MQIQSSFDVIIIGGSNAGLSAAMALGRALRKVLIVDNGKPCNRQTPHSHNLIMHDGWTPADMHTAAKKDVLSYETVQYQEGTVTAVNGIDNDFKITINNTQHVNARKVILATGIKDVFPAIEGFAECWGISVIHCPYCHGYEYRSKVTGILANGDGGFEMARMINNWTKNLTIFTNGSAAFTEEQLTVLSKHNIAVISNEILAIKHNNGYLHSLVLKEAGEVVLDALYARLPFTQNTGIPEHLGCALTEQGYLHVDNLQRTTVPGIFACGDNSTFMRSVSAAIASGTMAGVAASKEFFDLEF
ncbi:NAD(P)/FAD-dependent oxidoreductase [Mucilaginibacter hurinus]|uniref:NAD(P)/FAD-dependent oxidoreductase n=1 Tax=Mucilaginibacter hurinus TaxID=2201324 RepID=A0A367GNI5_9SPHI|nr:NAD(P)/FAD-dependent oxidoreductase [Mucilaginibacter hurinus]RCH54416.1 NAD(P)/FAD-dependent oxidoreductase [Mucilaginibacter hurinus]